MPELCSDDWVGGPLNEVHPKIFDKQSFSDTFYPNILNKIVEESAVWESKKLLGSPESRCKTPEPQIGVREVAKPVFRTPPTRSAAMRGPLTSTQRGELPRWADSLSSMLDSTMASSVCDNEVIYLFSGQKL